MKIDKVVINNFKSLKQIDLKLKNLTLITGLNSTGKSSFIQALLLLKQNKNNLDQISSYEMMKSFSINDKEILTHLKSNIENISLLLDGEYVSLGNKKDILYQEVFDENIDIEIYFGKDFLKTHYDIKLKMDVEFSNHGVYQVSSLFLSNFQYIMTDRVPPSITNSLSETHIKENLIGLRGEYTAHFLAVNKNKKIYIEALKHPESKTNQFLENSSLWLREISPGIDIDSTVNPSQNNVTLTYTYFYGESKTNKFNPLNVGFGITYVLPIIVSILKSKPNDLLIIENPESHLHPAGQSKIAELCAIACSRGVQIIVETHSDHFLNGVRVAVKKDILKHEDSQVYYFKKENDALETKVVSLNIDGDGNINDNWPKGFFDEYRNKLDELLW